MIDTWTTRDGEDLLISEMETSHIKNCINYLRVNPMCDGYGPDIDCIYFEEDHELTAMYIKAFEEELARRESEEKIKNNIWDENLIETVNEIKGLIDGDWSWGYNPQCKYIDIRIDMRDGGFVIRDRDGNRINMEQLKKQ